MSDIKEFGLDAIKSLGFPIVICGFLMFAGYEMVRGDREQIKSDKAYIRSTLNTRMEESTEALRGVEKVIERNTAVVEKNTAIQQQVLNALEKEK